MSVGGQLGALHGQFFLTARSRGSWMSFLSRDDPLLVLPSKATTPARAVPRLDCLLILS